jgi:phosphoribosylformylglycinamidine synthase
VNFLLSRLLNEYLPLSDQILSHTINSCHDLSDGGLLIALTEMALAGNIGATVDVPDITIPFHAWGFGEDQARYLVTTLKSDELLSQAKKANVLAQIIGKTGGTEIKIDGVGSLEISELRQIHEHWMPTYMC